MWYHCQNAYSTSIFSFELHQIRFQSNIVTTTLQIETSTGSNCLDCCIFLMVFFRVILQKKQSAALLKAMLFQNIAMVTKMKKIYFN